FCRPSRGPTSTILTREGRFFMGLSLWSVAAQAIDLAHHGFAALQGGDLARDLRDAVVAQRARRGVGGDGDAGVRPERVFGRQWLGAEDVERGARQVAFVEQREQVFID